MKTLANLTFYQAMAGVAFTTGLLLLTPLIAMQYTSEVVWTLSDFIIAGGLLFGTGAIYLLVTRKLLSQLQENTVYRWAVGVALSAALLLIWANLAVGIIGSENNPYNLFYFGVIAVGIVGSLVARFRPWGMAFTMFAMALAQVLVTAVALIGGFYSSPPTTLLQVIGVNVFFITMFLATSYLFRYADRLQQTKVGTER